jgi:hypothetical protein
LVEEHRTLGPRDPIARALGTRAVSAGRSMGEAQGVDGLVFIAGTVGIGEFVSVTLDGTTSFDFYGTPARELAALG